MGISALAADERVADMRFEKVEGLDRLAQPLLPHEDGCVAALHIERPQPGGHRLPEKSLGLHERALLHGKLAEERESARFISMLPEVLDDKCGSGVEPTLRQLYFGLVQPRIGDDARH